MEVLWSRPWDSQRAPGLSGGTGPSAEGGLGPSLSQLLGATAPSCWEAPESESPASRPGSRHIHPTAAHHSSSSVRHRHHSQAGMAHRAQRQSPTKGRCVGQCDLGTCQERNEVRGEAGGGCTSHCSTGGHGLGRCQEGKAWVVTPRSAHLIIRELQIKSRVRNHP